MEKLTKYNLKLLAIIGTTIVAGAIIALLAGIGGVLISFMSSRNNSNNGIQIQNIENTNKDTLEIHQTQAISFETPIQLDTGNANFIIPVGQKNIETQETIRLESGSGIKFSGGNYRYNSFYGLYNNFIYFNYENNFKHKIFNDKTAITHWSFLKIKNKEVLLFKGTKTDSNLDNQLNGSDFQSLFVYYLSDKKLIEYRMDNATVLSFEPMQKTNLIAISVGIDKDSDKLYERNFEPQEIKTLDIDSRELENIISDKTKNEIQNDLN